MKQNPVVVCCIIPDHFAFIQQGPDSSSNTSSCNSSTPSSPALVMTTHTPHSTTKQQFHFPGKKCSFLLSWNLVVFIKLQMQHGLYIIATHCCGTFFLCMFPNIYEMKWYRKLEIEIECQREIYACRCDTCIIIAT